MNAENLVEMLRERRHSELPVGYCWLDSGEVDGPRTEWTWAEVDSRARAVAFRLQQLGLEGERALLLFPPGLDFIAGFFGCLYAGVVAVPAYPPDPTRLQATVPRLQAIVRDARPAVILTTALVEQLARGLAPIAPELAVLEAVAVDACEPDWADRWQMPDISPDTLAFLQYTSGSTGTPKGVMLSHGNLLANQRMISASFGGDGQTWGCSWLPLFHDMGLIGTVLNPIYRDRPTVLMSPLDFLKKPLRWLQAISSFGADISGAPDFAYALCARKARPEDIARLDLSRWKIAFSGAEPVRAETLENFARIFAPAGFDPKAFYPTYGLAEATLLVSGGAKGLGARTKGHEGRRVVDCGPAAADCEIAIFRADETRASEGEVGHVFVRSPAVARGYFDRPVETEQTFGFTTAEGRWLRTGDLGFLDAGHLFVTGRSKDLLILRGRNHYPHDIERTVEAAHPAIRAGCIAAFAVPTANGEGLAIAAELDPGADFGAVEEAIRAAVALGHELSVEGLAFLAPRTLPKTSSGKVQRHACKKAWTEDAFELVHRSGVAPERVAGLPDWLVGWLRQEAKVGPERLRAGARLQELGLDSITIVQLAGAMEEHLGIEVPVEVLFGRTLADLAGWLQVAGLPLGGFERPDLEASAALPSDIVPQGQVNGQGLFLTGATGFLGAHLLAELANRTDRPLICLVRAADPESGRERIRGSAGRLGVGVDLDRVEVVCGDLTEPRLGLSPEDFGALARKVGSIVHCGARIDWSARYEELVAPNVRGTQEVVRLSALGGGIPIHHVSSLGVYPVGLSRQERFGEQDDVAEGELLRIPYFQSKWAAERLLEQARARGIPVAVYRPGFVLGDSLHGAELDPRSQLMGAFIAGVARMGQVPAVDKVLDAVPVDFVAKAIAALSLRDDSLNRKFNLKNPHPLPQSAFYAMLRARGFRLTPTAYTLWRERVLRLPREDAENPLARFALYYRAVTPGFMRRLESVLAHQMPIGDDLAAEVLTGLDIRCPPFDARLVDVMIGAYLRSGLLQPPRIEVMAPPSAHAPILLDLPTLARPWLGGLSDTEGRLVRLYDKAKQRQWDSNVRLDWSLPVDDADPQGMGDEGVPIFGSPVWTKLSPDQQVEVRRNHQAWQLSQFLAGEQGALQCAGRIVAQAPDAAARMYCATQVVDEARHIEVFSRLLHQKIGISYAVSAPLQHLLDDVLYAGKWDLTCLGMQVLIEGMGLAAFSMVRDRSRHPLVAAAHAYITEDEARHVSFGKVMLSKLYQELTDKERDEREEFVVEACYLLRDRFAARDLWEQLDLPVDRCVGWVEDSGAMRFYRAELFKRIVPIVRSIGLWGPRVRDAYARMGVLDYGVIDVDRVVHEDEQAARRFDRAAT